ncbi:tRNA pseudouridine(13) synthase TruD, partial [Nanoarchaeota archaeon]
MYKIKQTYEDFCVEEIPKFKLGDGDFVYFWLEKAGLNTSEALGLLAKKMGLGLKKFGYAGNKDRRAVTKQVCSVQSVKSLDVGLKKVKVKVIGHGRKPISLGDLEGNKFEIVIRNLSEDEAERVKPIKKMINYFGEQRFSTDNVEIGRAMVKGDFKKVAELLLKNDLVKNRIKKVLEERPNDFVNAVRMIERRLLMLFVHAYQAWIWNEGVEEILKAKKKVKKVPIVGFGT